MMHLSKALVKRFQSFDDYEQKSREVKKKSLDFD